MAKPQTELIGIPIENMLAQANARVLQEKEDVSIERLQRMSRNELMALIQRISGARWGEVALMNRQERLEAGNLRLWHAGLTGTDVSKWLPALREVLDRELGKSVTPIAAQVLVKDEQENPPDIKQLAREIEFCLAITKDT